MGLPDYLSRAPVVNNDMSEDGEQENHKLNPEYLQNLVRPSGPALGVTGSSKSLKRSTTWQKSADVKRQSAKVTDAPRKIIS